VLDNYWHIFHDARTVECKNKGLMMFFLTKPKLVTWEMYVTCKVVTFKGS